MADGTSVIEAPDREVAVQSEGIQYVALVAEAVRDPNVDTDKMRAILDMKREEEDREVKRAFNRAFVAAKRDIKPIVRNKRNEQTKSNYADAIAVADVVDPIMDKHGLALTYGTEPCEIDGFYRMVADLVHEDGHEKRYTADIPNDNAGIKGTVNKTPTHAFGSSTTYGKRYMKMMIWDISTKDDDGNGANEEPVIGADQVQQIRGQLLATETDEALFCNFCKIPTLEDMPLSKFNPAMQRLRNKAKSGAPAQ